MNQPYNILPSKIADRTAKTFYYYKGKVRWWNGKRLRNKEADRRWNKRYRAENREKIKKYRADNREKLNEYSKKYRADNREKLNEYNKKYDAKNKEKKKEYDKDPANKKRKNKRYRWRYKNDENYRLTRLLRERFRKALKSKNIKKNSHVLELTSCSMDFLKNYLSKQFEKGMTWENHGEWHIDHRKPCASFDLAKKEEQRKCFHYTNLQPLLGKENMEKSATFNEATYEYKWTEEQGWVLR